MVITKRAAVVLIAAVIALTVAAPGSGAAPGKHPRNPETTRLFAGDAGRTTYIHYGVWTDYTCQRCPGWPHVTAYTNEGTSDPRGTLTTAAGSPVVGVTLVATLPDGEELCTMTTGSSGGASCSLTEEQKDAATGAGAYVLTFAGDTAYLPASDEASYGESVDQCQDHYDGSYSCTGIV